MKTYYLKVDARYSVKTEEVDDDGEVFAETHYHTRVWHSNSFDTLDAAISFGNQFIISNKWIEQYPGYIGQRLKKGITLITFRLKNGAEVFMSVRAHDTPTDFENVLQFLNDTCNNT